MENKRIELGNKELTFVIDVDGVLTTGQFLYSEKGKAFKIFGAHDADGLKLIKDKVNILFISADKRGFKISKKRIEDMGYPLYHVHESEREGFFRQFDLDKLIFIGDGIFDAPIIKKCMFGIAPANARIEARNAADFITPSRSAEGAFCDACIKINKLFFEGKK